MFDSLTRGRPAPRRPAALGLELLERRDYPSAAQPGEQLWLLLNTSPSRGGTTSNTAPALSAGSHVKPALLVDLAPVIHNFGFVASNSPQYTFSGIVSNTDPTGLTVTFGGIPSLVGKTATANADGTFSLTVSLNCNGSDNGTAWAQTTSWSGVPSNQATVYVSV
jgi:hypothetical protein